MLRSHWVRFRVNLRSVWSSYMLDFVSKLLRFWTLLWTNRWRVWEASSFGFSVCNRRLTEFEDLRSFGSMCFLGLKLLLSLRGLGLVQLD